MNAELSPRAKTALYGLLCVLLVPFVFPTWWMVTSSVKPISDIFAFPPDLIPRAFDWTTYRRVFELQPFARQYWNSAYIAVLVTLGTMLVSSMAGYAFARIRFPGRELLFYLYLATLMIPQQVTLTPLFIVMTWLHWGNSYQALILPASFGAFGTFLMRQFFLRLPREVEEAAFVDGAGYVRIFFTIAMSLARPAMATLAVFAFMASWNSFLWPLIITSDRSMMTLPLGLSFLQGRYTTDWNVLMAGTVLATLPIIAVYVFAQRYIIQGLSTTGLK